MKCEMCHANEATVHLTQVVDGTVRKLHLCETCAAESGLDVQNPMSIADLFLGLGPAPETARTGDGGECPQCHLRRSDFKKTGRLGCPFCYTYFREELAPMLKAMHRGERHVGKRPALEEAASRHAAALAELRRKLEEAVGAENYEEAARLRDEIRRLSGEPAPGADGKAPAP